MNILADESVDGQIVYRLRRDGHLVHYVAEMEPGISDDVVLGLANREAALLLTADRDFGELVYRQGRTTFGIVLVRLAGLSPARKADIVSSTLDQHLAELLHSFTVISPGTVRVRGTSS
jgi:predicted nuclease of predicted toxin-antitoxin system